MPQPITEISIKSNAMPSKLLGPHTTLLDDEDKPIGNVVKVDLTTFRYTLADKTEGTAARVLVRAKPNVLAAMGITLPKRVEVSENPLPQ